MRKNIRDSREIVVVNLVLRLRLKTLWTLVDFIKAVFYGDVLVESVKEIRKR